MANETILISEVIPTTPQRIFSAWLDSAEHSSFTGSQAALLPFVGGEYSAWDGYVQGRTLELNDGARIVQSWRTTEFPADSPDSRLEITLEATLGGTLLTLLHTDIPSGQSDRVREGWNQYYLSRMKSYFGEAVAAADEEDFAAAVDALGAGDDAPTVADSDFPLPAFEAPAAVAPKRAAPKKVVKKAVKAAAKKVKAAARKPAKKLKAAAKKPAKKLKAAAKKRPVTKKAAKRPKAKRPKARAKAAKATRTSGKKPKPAPRKRR